MGALSGLLARTLALASEVWAQPARLRCVRVARLVSAPTSVGIGGTLLARSIGVS
jgi:hypothetical protein